MIIDVINGIIDVKSHESLQFLAIDSSILKRMYTSVKSQSMKIFPQSSICISFIDSTDLSKYFNLYVKLIDQPHLAVGTNPGWIQFCQDGYHSFIERLHQKGDMYEAMIKDNKMKGNTHKYLSKRKRKISP